MSESEIGSRSAKASSDSASPRVAQVHTDVSGLVVGIIGGTGQQGRGLASRLSRAGQDVVIGGRDGGRAADVAATLGHRVRGLENRHCCSAADIVIVAVPWAAHEDSLRDLATDLAGKIVVDCVNPLGFDAQGPFALAVTEGSAAQQAAKILSGATVTAAFHHISASLLLDETVESIDTDVLVLGDDRAATDLVAALANRIPGLRGIYGGRLRDAAQVEALTANLIAINRRYAAHAGVRITDV